MLTVQISSLLHTEIQWVGKWRELARIRSFTRVVSTERAVIDTDEQIHSSIVNSSISGQAEWEENTIQSHERSRWSIGRVLLSMISDSRRSINVRDTTFMEHVNTIIIIISASESRRRRKGERSANIKIHRSCVCECCLTMERREREKEKKANVNELKDTAERQKTHLVELFRIEMFHSFRETLIETRGDRKIFFIPQLFIQFIQLFIIRRFQTAFI